MKKRIGMGSKNNFIRFNKYFATENYSKVVGVFFISLIYEVIYEINICHDLLKSQHKS